MAVGIRSNNKNTEKMLHYINLQQKTELNIIKYIEKKLQNTPYNDYNKRSSKLIINSGYTFFGAET